MRGTHALAGGVGLRIDRIAAVHPAGRVLARQNRIGLVTHVRGVLDVDRPSLAIPPDDLPGLQVVAGQNLHACASSANWASAASSRVVTSPMMMSAGLFTRCVSTSPGRAASAERSTRMFARAAFSITARGIFGERPSAISFSAIMGAVLTPM